MPSRYQQALDYLYEQLPMFHRIGSAAFKKDLTNIRSFCDKLGNPQESFPSIHIAGTNGKGSVAHMLASIFTASGFKTGLYTSPHYRDFRERVKIDGELIPKQNVVDFVDEHKAFCSELKPSYFEWTVALAFDYFRQEKVDIAIIETGLGGRLDSTNIVTPLLSVITNIGLDHTDMLGETLPLIAGEKAGIIKKNVPVVVGESHPETQKVFEKKANNESAPLYFADKHFKAVLSKKTDTHSLYQIQNGNSPFLINYTLNHLGDYQHKNLCTVLMAVSIFENYYPDLLPPEGLNVPAGLYNLRKYAGFLGRWEFISLKPRILCDSAHNEDGIRLAMDGLQKIAFDQLHFVIGMVNDKPPAKILSLLPKEATYYFCKANIPRGLDANVLREAAHAFGLKGKTYASVRHALAAAKRRAAENDLIFVGGSIFVVAEVI